MASDVDLKKIQLDRHIVQVRKIKLKMIKNEWIFWMFCCVCEVKLLKNIIDFLACCFPEEEKN